ncbi:nuclear transport factor 2 family protein [Aminobacter sp. AP02]|uniref:nuclear transport factor 2 family protein n=1 Tax=Aminobacter sp. AP02 TaxID=2135737 RepID=UPI000D6B4363|nr:nuclear transport factor 2 family protein [Aminobacter sp. AP02]PWK73932.1 SnoaL-like protein [Aminobacter sp. AP02]
MDTETQLALLEARIKGLEDQLAIYQLLATYGPSVDSRTGDVTASLWAQDGRYDFGAAPLEGAETVGSLVNIEPHINYVADGCAHVISMPYVSVDGDRAVATGYSRVYLNQGDHWRVERAGANRWELVRTTEGWRVHNRINRLLNGQSEARSLLSQGVKPKE